HVRGQAGLEVYGHAGGGLRVLQRVHTALSVDGAVQVGIPPEAVTVVHFCTDQVLDIAVRRNHPRDEAAVVAEDLEHPGGWGKEGGGQKVRGKVERVVARAAVHGGQPETLIEDEVVIALAAGHVLAEGEGADDAHHAAAGGGGDVAAIDAGPDVFGQRAGDG